jgi:hypothetical protein
MRALLNVASLHKAAGAGGKTKKRLQVEFIQLYQLTSSIGSLGPTLNNQTGHTHRVDLCFMLFSEETMIVFLNSINGLSVMETQCISYSYEVATVFLAFFPFSEK